MVSCFYCYDAVSERNRCSDDETFKDLEHPYIKSQLTDIRLPGSFSRTMKFVNSCYILAALVRDFEIWLALAILEQHVSRLTTVRRGSLAYYRLENDNLGTLLYDLWGTAFARSSVDGCVVSMHGKIRTTIIGVD